MSQGIVAKADCGDEWKPEWSRGQGGEEFRGKRGTLFADELLVGRMTLMLPLLGHVSIEIP
jgi:hypothetical protein